MASPSTRDRHGHDRPLAPNRGARDAEKQDEGPCPPRDTHQLPDDYRNLSEVAAEHPTHGPTLEQVRHDEEAQQRQNSSGSRGHQGHQETGSRDAVSPRMTQLYTLSYLVFFALVGTLARLGLTALTRYANTPVLFTGVWSNFAGSLVMGFLAEDRMLFRQEWGTATYDRVLAAQAKKEHEDGEGGGAESGHLAAAKRAHLACKKTIPLYIGLATGFCGSFTSFSAFMRDVFLAVSDDMPAPGAGAGAGESRSGGSSFMAMAAVVITTVVLSLGGLVFGAHCAMATERVVPSLPYPATRRFVDPVFVLLGWGCWLGALALAVFPPHDEWRGQVVFALVLAPLGCLARFYLALWLNGKMAALPLGTLAANVLGTAVLAMAWDVAHVRSGGVVGCQVLQGVEDGFCGCLTTVSTWVVELRSLRRPSAYVYGLTSVLVSFAVLVLIMGGLRWTDGWAALAC
ncbi:hypothetical protein E4U41_002603 [Claviceps citrina]|nr:hypothetical protein E4U41_002603 [Claviceps citrina]